MNKKKKNKRSRYISSPSNSLTNKCTFRKIGFPRTSTALIELNSHKRERREKESEQFNLWMNLRNSSTTREQVSLENRVGTKTIFEPQVEFSRASFCVIGSNSATWYENACIGRSSDKLYEWCTIVFWWNGLNIRWWWIMKVLVLLSWANWISGWWEIRGWKIFTRSELVTSLVWQWKISTSFQ